MTHRIFSTRKAALFPLLLALGCTQTPAADSAASPAEAPSPATKDQGSSRTVEVQVGKAVPFEGELLALSDFESGSLEHALGGAWVTSSDPHGLGTTLAPSPFQVTEGGAEASKHAIRIHGHFGKNVSPWPYADVRAPFERTDLSAFSKVRFWTKGDGKKYVLAIVRTAVSDYCHYRAGFVAPSEWTQVELPLASFFQPDWGVKRPIDWRDAEALSFQPDASLNDESFDLWIDKVELVR